jgi:ABC-type polysaccharide/polyol phosphate export permease
MKLALRPLLTKALLAFFALQIINMGIDAIEFQPYDSSAIGEFNYFNSMTEYISEIMLQNKDAFPEFQKKSTKDSQVIKHIDIKIFHAPIASIGIQTFPARNNYIIPLEEDYTYCFSKEINPPPVWS